MDVQAGCKLLAAGGICGAGTAAAAGGRPAPRGFLSARAPQQQHVFMSSQVFTFGASGGERPRARLERGGQHREPQETCLQANRSRQHAAGLEVCAGKRGRTCAHKRKRQTGWEAVKTSFQSAERK